MLDANSNSIEDHKEASGDLLALSQHLFAEIGIADMRSMSHAASDSGSTASAPLLQLAFDGPGPIHGDDPNGGSGPIHGPDPNGEQHPPPIQPIQP